MPAANIRVPPGLHELAKLEADRLGISLNALFCVALDAWLSRGKPQEALEAKIAPNPVPHYHTPHLKTAPEPVLSRQQRRALERKNRK